MNIHVVIIPKIQVRCDRRDLNFTTGEIMKNIAVLLTLLLTFSTANAKILCMDNDPLTGDLCLTKQTKKPNADEVKFIKRMKLALDTHIKKNCLPKDNTCIRQMWIEYCDTDIKVCNVFGETIYDSGLFYVYRLVYDVKTNGWISINNLTHTSSYNYPN